MENDAKSEYSTRLEPKTCCFVISCINLSATELLLTNKVIIYFDIRIYIYTYTYTYILFKICFEFFSSFDLSEDLKD